MMIGAGLPAFGIGGSSVNPLSGGEDSDRVSVGSDQKARWCGMESKSGTEAASYFHDAAVEWEGRTYCLSAADGRTLENPGNYWHGPENPSTWLAVAVFLEARRRVGNAGDRIALELAAKALGITVDRLRSGIEWHENYIRWHDGDPDYSVL
jgi:hypothetical protein